MHISLTLRLMALPLLVAIGGASLAEDWHFSADAGVVAISDVHGDYDAMQETLRRAGIVDEKLQWSAGAVHLVVTGDLLDRGPDSRRVMDLLRSLETAAAEQGGTVHLLLGNHEVMNLVGDLRYVADGEYAAFAEDESAAERERWFEHYLATEGAVVDRAVARQAWDERHPPGFFAHRRAFRSDGEYGAWLLQKPVIVVINDTAFVHGGLSPRVADLGLAGVNGGLKDELRTYVEQLQVLNDAGVLSPAANFYSHADLLAAVPDDADRPAAVTAAIDAVTRLGKSRLHASDSPLWYRGNVGCSAPIEVDRLAAALESIGARRVVIGHTPTLTHQVLSRLGGRVIEIDTGMLNAYYGGTGNALVIDADQLRVVAETTAAGEAVVPHPRRVGLRSPELSALRLEEILRSGDIEPKATDDMLGEVVNVSHDGTTVSALFVPNPRRRGLVPELAAYRLDRFLELGMVPVTVARDFNGKSGVLQFLPDQRVNEKQRHEASGGGGAWCPLPEQWNAMYTFDALLHNPGRAQEHMLYSPDNYQLFLIGHTRSFGAARGKPDYLQQVPLKVGGFWRERLSALTDEQIAELFAGSLDRRRQRALGQRRDLLLAEAR